MGWFKRLNNKLIRVNAAMSFGVDDTGKEIVVGRQADLGLDSLYTNGSASHYGKGSIVFLTGGTIRIVDADGLWQSVTTTTVSQSASPSGSGSPSASRSPSASGSPSGSASPSHSASPST